MANTDSFAYNRKIGSFLMERVEKQFVAQTVKYIPGCIQTHHLTLCTILWSVLALLFNYMAKNNIQWMWVVIAIIIAQYLTDVFDGAIGRYRHTGLVRWGYFMDHFLDYIFLCSLIIGWSMISKGTHSLFYFILMVAGGYMLNSFLSFSVLRELKIYFFYIGPTEIRILIILFNIFLIFFGKQYIDILAPYILFALVTCLFIIVYKTQNAIWRIDMETRKYLPQLSKQNAAVDRIQ